MVKELAEQRAACMGRLDFIQLESVLKKYEDVQTQLQLFKTIENQGVTVTHDPQEESPILEEHEHESSNRNILAQLFL